MAYIGAIGAVCFGVFLYLGITPMVNPQSTERMSVAVC